MLAVIPVVDRARTRSRRVLRTAGLYPECDLHPFLIFDFSNRQKSTRSCHSLCFRERHKRTGSCRSQAEVWPATFEPFGPSSRMPQRLNSIQGTKPNGTYFSWNAWEYLHSRAGGNPESAVIIAYWISGRRFVSPGMTVVLAARSPQAVARLRLLQIRTCPIQASGSSGYGGAARR